MAFVRALLGHGIGLRSKHYGRFLEERPDVGWIEAISENFIDVGGRPLAVLEKVRGDFPLVLHGVSLSIGSVDPLDLRHLAGLRALADRIEPAYHGFDAREYISAIPPERVGQFHLAGYSDRGTYLFDTHDAPVADPVWELYAAAVRRFGHVPTLIEWDDRVPELERLVEESRAAAAVEARELAAREAA